MSAPLFGGGIFGFKLSQKVLPGWQGRSATGGNICLGVADALSDGFYHAVFCCVLVVISRAWHF